MIKPKLQTRHGVLRLNLGKSYITVYVGKAADINFPFRSRIYVARPWHALFIQIGGPGAYKTASAVKIAFTWKKKKQLQWKWRFWRGKRNTNLRL